MEELMPPEPFGVDVTRVPLFAVLVAGGIVAVGLVTAFYPYPHPVAVLSIVWDKTEYAPAEPVRFIVTLWLGGNRPVTFFGDPCPKLAFAIDRTDGERVFHSLHGIACTQAIEAIVEFTMQPGGRLTQSYVWMQENNSGVLVPANEYEIVPVLRMHAPIAVSVSSARVTIE